MKKILFPTVIMFLLLFSAYALAAPSQFKQKFKVVYKGSSLNDRAIRKGVDIYIPMKSLLEKMKVKFTYDPKTYRVKVMQKNRTAIFFLGQNRINVNGIWKRVRARALSDDKIYIPTSYLEDVLGASYRVDNRKGILFISLDPTATTPDVQDLKDVQDIKDDIDI